MIVEQIFIRKKTHFLRINRRARWRRRGALREKRVCKDRNRLGKRFCALSLLHNALILQKNIGKTSAKRLQAYEAKIFKASRNLLRRTDETLMRKLVFNAALGFASDTVYARPTAQRSNTAIWRCGSTALKLQMAIN